MRQFLLFICSLVATNIQAFVILSHINNNAAKYTFSLMSAARGGSDSPTSDIMGLIPRTETLRRSSLTRGVRVMWALSSCNTGTFGRAKANDDSSKCGSIGCQSPLCKAGAEQKWYNKDNGHIFEAFYESGLAAES